MAQPPASMFHSRSHIREGDIVIVYLNRSDHLALTMTPGKQLHNKYGRYYHDDMIGLPFGSKMVSPPPEVGYVYLLRPTPELWTKSLPHRTQIVYQPDISYITMRLGIRAGGKVIEAGTGSGSMTHSLSRLVGPSGYVGSYEYHQTRYVKAKEEFESHGLTNVRVAHRNVCKEGFGNVSNVEAVFLDLPAPWEAIPHVMKVIRPDVIVKICCFSPCIEQVTKTCSALRSAGFGEVSTQEVLIRTHDIPIERPSGIKPLRDISTIVKTLKTHEVKKAERRVTQMRNAREKLLRSKQAAAEKAGEGSAGAESGAGAEAETEADAGPAAEGSVKRKAEEEEPEQQAKRARTDGDVGPSAPDAELDPTQDNARPKWTAPETPESTIHSQILLRIQPEMRGHTSYLTFATLPPLHIRDVLSGKTDTIVRGAKSCKAETEIAETATDVPDDKTVTTEYADADMDDKLGTLTEEEMLAMLSRD